MKAIKKAEIVKLFEDLKPYIRHASYCTYTTHINSNPDSDFCTCDFDKVVKRIQKFLKSLQVE